MVEVAFTAAELSELNNKQLRSLCEYYGLPKSGKRLVLLGRLYRFYFPVTVEEKKSDEPEIEPEMSVRIRRIKESTNGS